MAHQIGSSVSISCSSDLAIQTIRWLNNSDNGWELLSNSEQRQLLLPIENVSLTDSDTSYTCEVMLVGSGVNVERTITIHVNSNYFHFLLSELYLCVMC